MRIRGIASTPTLDVDRIRIKSGALNWSIERRGVAGIRLLLDHDPTRPAGHITKLETVEDRLMIEAVLNPALPGVSDRIRDIQQTRRHAFSVGFYPLRFRRSDDGTRLIHNGNLFEVSVVPEPANPDCWITFDEKSKWEGFPPDFFRMFEEHEAAEAAVAERRQKIEQTVHDVLSSCGLRGAPSK